MKSPKEESRTHRLIWETVRRIPRGKVATYKQIAEICGWINRARLVGYALHNLPPGSTVPWHRVINSQGKISLSDLDGMHNKQKRLLRKEGVVFLGDKVDMRTHHWHPDFLKYFSR